jgi:hypothetical protein
MMMYQPQFVSFISLIAVCCPSLTVSFGIHPINELRNDARLTHSTTTVKTTTQLFVVVGSGDDEDRIIGDNTDFIPAEENSVEYTGSVDWDAEWKKVMKNKDNISSSDRPGKNFYKSDAEIAAIVSTSTDFFF